MDLDKNTIGVTARESPIELEEGLGSGRGMVSFFVGGRIVPETFG